jgi:hypothetical protein
MEIVVDCQTGKVTKRQVTDASLMVVNGLEGREAVVCLPGQSVAHIEVEQGGEVAAVDVPLIDRRGAVLLDVLPGPVTVRCEGMVAYG